MRCPEFAKLDELLDRLQARWLYAVELGTPGTSGHDAALLRIVFGPTLGGMQYSLATLRHGMAGKVTHFSPAERPLLRLHVARLIAEFEVLDPAVVRLRERLGPKTTDALAPVYHLYPVASVERTHSAH